MEASSKSVRCGDRPRCQPKKGQHLSAPLSSLLPRGILACGVSLCPFGTPAPFCGIDFSVFPRCLLVWESDFNQKVPCFPRPQSLVGAPTRRPPGLAAAMSVVLGEPVQRPLGLEPGKLCKELGWGSLGWAQEDKCHWKKEGGTQRCGRRRGCDETFFRKAECVGTGTRGWSTDHTGHRPERKWMVVVDEERGRGHRGSQSPDFSPTEIQAELPGEPAGAWLGHRVLVTIAQTGTNLRVPGRTDPRPWPVHAAGASEPQMGATADTRGGTGTSVGAQSLLLCDG